MVSGPGPGQRGEDLLQRRAADLALSRGRERELAVPVLDDLVLLEGLREFFEVDRGVDDPTLLQVPHPLERFLDVAPCLEHELQEELDQLLVGQELPEQVDGVVLVAVAHLSYQLSAIGSQLTQTQF